MEKIKVVQTKIDYALSRLIRDPAYYEMTTKVDDSVFATMAAVVNLKLRRMLQFQLDDAIPTQMGEKLTSVKEKISIDNITDVIHDNGISLHFGLYTELTGVMSTPVAKIFTDLLSNNDFYASTSSLLYRTLLNATQDYE